MIDSIAPKGHQTGERYLVDLRTVTGIPRFKAAIAAVLPLKRLIENKGSVDNVLILDAFFDYLWQDLFMDRPIRPMEFFIATGPTTDKKLLDRFVAFLKDSEQGVRLGNEDTIERFVRITITE